MRGSMRMEGRGVRFLSPLRERNGDGKERRPLAASFKAPLSGSDSASLYYPDVLSGIHVHLPSIGDGATELPFAGA